MIDNSFSKVYVPASDKPKWFDSEVKAIGGDNPYGGGVLRVVWGMDVRSFRNNDPQAIKYPGPRGIGLDRWVLEVWRAAEFFGAPEAWELHRYFSDKTGKRVDALGDYPTRGMYTMAEPLTGPLFSYVPCDKTRLEYIRSRHQASINTPLNCYTSINAYRDMQDQMAMERESARARVDKEADEWGEYVATRAEQLNKTPKYSFPAKSLIVSGDAAQKAFNNLRGH